jgi:hypothetical protein
MTPNKSWSISGSYYESCNCQAVCPCRRLNGAPGGKSTYGICQFLLSWDIHRGMAQGVDLTGRQVVMAGFYDDAERGSPWSIKLFIDDRAPDAPLRQLERIFLGKAGGNMPFTSNISGHRICRRARRAQLYIMKGLSSCPPSAVVAPVPMPSPPIPRRRGG